MDLKKTTPRILCLSAAIALCACGGGGSSNSSEPEPGGTNLNFDGNVIDGYLVGAKVCADLNQNNNCDHEEPSAITGEFGKFTINAQVAESFLENTAYRCLIKSNCTDKMPIRFLAITDENTQNQTFNNNTSLNSSVVFSSTAFFSTVDGANSAQTQITPYTTMTDLAMGRVLDVTSVTEDELNNTFDKVTESLGVDPKIARTDYNDPTNVTEQTKKALIAGEVLVRSALIPETTEDLNDRMEANMTADDVVEVTSSVKEDVDIIVETTKELETKDIADALDKFSTDALTSIKMIKGTNSDEFKCGITKKNNVYCWGGNQAGNLGDIDKFPKDEHGNPVENGYNVIDNFQATPVGVKTTDGKLLSNVKTIDAGNGHVCAVTYDGYLYCWGSNIYGQTGTTETISKENNRVFAATKVLKGQQNIEGEYLSNVEDVILSHNASCAITKNGEVYCWGDNTVKQLGDTHQELEIKVKEGEKSLEGIDISDLVKVIPYPVKVKFPDTVAKVTKLAAGIWAYCALVENTDPADKHNLYCWGDDVRGLVSQNWKQYQEHFLNNYANKLMLEDQSSLADPDGVIPWRWHIYDQDKDWRPLYGAKVTRIDSLNDKGDKLELNNVTNLAITGFDSALMVELNNNSIIYKTYNNGTTDTTSFWTILSRKSFGGEMITKIVASVEDEVSFVLTETNSLYAIDMGGNNRYGMNGTGTGKHSINYGYDETINNFVIINPLKPLLDGRIMKNYVDVSVSKRSVCASVKKSNDDKITTENELYCWGSSTFGQLGFNDNNGGFSYTDTANEWDGYTSNNKYFNDETRIVYTPRKVEFQKEAK